MRPEDCQAAARPGFHFSVPPHILPAISIFHAVLRAFSMISIFFGIFLSGGPRQVHDMNRIDLESVESVEFLLLQLLSSYKGQDLQLCQVSEPADDVCQPADSVCRLRVSAGNIQLFLNPLLFLNASTYRPAASGELSDRASRPMPAVACEPPDAGRCLPADASVLAGSGQRVVNVFREPA